MIWTKGLFRISVLLLLWPTTTVFAQTLITQSNVNSLKQVWRSSTGSAIVATPVVQRLISGYSLSVETLFEGAANDTFYALNANTGAVLWTLQTGGPITLPAVSVPLATTIDVYFVSADGCLNAANADGGALQWKHCYTASSTKFVSLIWSAGTVLVAYNTTGAGGTIEAFNEQTGAAEWTYSSAQQFTGLTEFTGVSYNVATTSNALLAISTSGALVGSVALPGAPLGSPIVVKSGISETGGSVCPSENSVGYYAVVSIGESVYLSLLGASGPGSLLDVSLGSNIAAAPSVFFEFSYSSTRILDKANGLYYVCTTSYYNDDIFYPLASGAVSAAFVSDIGQIATNGTESAGALAEPLFFLLDESNPYGTTGMVFTAASSSVLVILTPAGTIDSVLATIGTPTGSTSDQYSPTAIERLYFADSAGYIYALSPTGH